MDRIILKPDGGEEVAFYPIEQTSVSGVDYLLVTDSEEGDGDAYLLKDISAPDEEEAVYVIVEDGAEADAVGRLFASMLEDDGIDLVSE